MSLGCSSGSTVYPGLDGCKLRPMQLRPKIIHLSKSPTRRHRRYLLLMKLRVQYHVLGIFLLTRIHPTRTRRKEASTCGRLGWSFSRLLWALISTNKVNLFCQHCLPAVRRSLTFCFQVISICICPSRCLLGIGACTKLILLEANGTIAPNRSVDDVGPANFTAPLPFGGRGGTQREAGLKLYMYQCESPCHHLHRYN